MRSLETAAEEGILLFHLPNREPKEDGVRNATDRTCASAYVRQGVSGGAGFLPSPSLDGNSGTGKIDRENSPGSQHREP